MKQKRGTLDTREITMRNLGIAAERALHYWQRLPVSVKNFYEADDMIDDVVLHIYRKANHYDADKGRASTFVYRVATRRCLDILAYYWAPKRGAAVTVPIEEHWAAADKAMVDNYAEESRNDVTDSKDAMERVIQFSPDFVRRALAELLSPEGQKRLPAQETIEAIRKIVQQHSATRKDFDTVLRCLVVA